LARGAWGILALVVCWQLALNMMLGPLSAWAADRVPREMTGFLGGLMALSPAMGALSGVVVTMPGLAGPDARLGLVAAMVVACVLPALLLVKPAPATDAPQLDSPRPPLRFAVTMWTARLLVQIAEAALFAYLLLYFRSLEPGMDESWIARLFSAVLAAAVPIAILFGRWADRSRRPARPLATCALFSAAGLIAMALASTVDQAVAAYVCFGLATTVFLSLHSGQTLRVLPSRRHRGRDLGLFNLTNTIPSLIMPWLTIAIVPRNGFSALFAVLALLALASAALLFTLKRLD
jgi:predicted MFS family arabinose efflux permease